MKLIMKNGMIGYHQQAVLKHVSFQVDQGEIVGILGPNGVGKTTVFKTIMGFIKLLDGEILLDQKPLKKLSPREFSRNIGYVPQNHESAFPFRVEDVVAMGRVAYLKPFSNPAAEDYRIVESVLNGLGIHHLANSYYNEISGGEKQMVLVARALAQRPSFLLMDEPTANMDLGNQVHVLRQMRRLANQNLGVIMTTHNPDHAFLCCDRVILITKDKKVVEGNVNEVVTEENLYHAYGVNVKIMEQQLNNGMKIKSCVPAIDS